MENKTNNLTVRVVLTESSKQYLETYQGDLDSLQFKLADTVNDDGTLLLEIINN